MTTILPCPFCGNDGVEIDEVSLSEYAVDCPECRAIGPICGTIMEAISYWNDRRGQYSQSPNAARFEFSMEPAAT